MGEDVFGEVVLGEGVDGVSEVEVAHAVAVDGLEDGDAVAAEGVEGVERVEVLGARDGGPAAGGADAHARGELGAEVDVGVDVLHAVVAEDDVEAVLLLAEARALGDVAADGGVDAAQRAVVVPCRVALVVVHAVGRREDDKLHARAAAEVADRLVDDDARHRDPVGEDERHDAREERERGHEVAVHRGAVRDLALRLDARAARHVVHRRVRVLVRADELVHRADVALEVAHHVAPRRADVRAERARTPRVVEPAQAQHARVRAVLPRDQRDEHVPRHAREPRHAARHQHAAPRQRRDVRHVPRRHRLRQHVRPHAVHQEHRHQRLPARLRAQQPRRQPVRVHQAQQAQRAHQPQRRRRRTRTHRLPLGCASGCSWCCRCCEALLPSAWSHVFLFLFFLSLSLSLSLFFCGSFVEPVIQFFLFLIHE